MRIRKLKCLLAVLVVALTVAPALPYPRLPEWYSRGLTTEKSNVDEAGVEGRMPGDVSISKILEPRTYIRTGSNKAFVPSPRIGSGIHCDI
jgi:hypothetical protein